MQHQHPKPARLVRLMENTEVVTENDHQTIADLKTDEIKPVIPQIIICESGGCKSAIDQIHSFYDPTVDACDDFYQYACGGYINKTQIPPDQVAVNVFSEILDILLVQLQTLINEPIRPEETKPFRLAKELYSACLNESLLEERGTGPLVEFANQFGGWPVVLGEKWDNDDKWNWIQMNIELHAGGFPFDSIFGLSVQTDLLNSSVRTLDVRT